MTRRTVRSPHGKCRLSAATRRLRWRAWFASLTYGEARACEQAYLDRCRRRGRRVPLETTG
jgi:hypothetical protein